jgi:hypothetical protein
MLYRMTLPNESMTKKTIVGECLGQSKKKM